MQIIQFSAKEHDVWAVDDLRQFLTRLNALYSRLYICSQLKVGAEIKISSRVSQVPKEYWLLIDSIEIHSPALIKIKGAHKIVKQFRYLLMDIIDIPHRVRMNKQKYKERVVKSMRKNGFPKEATNAVISDATGLEKIMRKCNMTVDRKGDE